MSEVMKNKDGIIIDPKYKKYTAFKLHNVEGFWCKVTEPDTQFEHKWSVDLHLTDAQATELKAVGFNVKDITNKKTGVVTPNVLKAVKKVKNKDGSENKAPTCVGPDGKTPFTEKIGNGSKLNLNLTAKAWFIQGQWSLSCYLDGVQVAELVEYAGGFGDVSGDTEGASGSGLGL